jgi:hypothetical protein
MSGSAVEGLQHHLAQQQRGCRRAVELIGQVKAQGALDAIVVEDRRVQIAGEDRFVVGVPRVSSRIRCQTGSLTSGIMVILLFA